MNFLSQRKFAALVGCVSFFIYYVCSYDNKRQEREKEKKKHEKATHKKNNHFFLPGYFLASAAISFQNWFDSHRMEGSRMNAGQGHLGAGTQRSLLFFLSLFSLSYYGHGLFFLFFLSFFPIYLLSHSFIVISIAALGGFNLYTHSLFSSSLYNLAYFFPLALLHIIILTVLAFFCFF